MMTLERSENEFMDAIYDAISGFPSFTGFLPDPLDV